MLRQAAATAAARVPFASDSDRRAALSRLRDTLIAGRNTDGGWGYYPGKTSRLEPTCWALLALGSAEQADDSAAEWFTRCQLPSGALSENLDWPINFGFNALAAFTLLHRRALASDELRRRLLAFVVTSKGEAAPQSESQRQDNSLQGWSWVNGTFSWVEPTCWGLLALKKARAVGFGTAAADARIAEAERLLIDRTCVPGGWNFGNARVLGQNLRPYVPVTALGLLAMSDRRDEPAIVSSLTALEALWQEEVSSVAVGLSLQCLRMYARPAAALEAQLIAHTEDALAFGNHHGIAVALSALASSQEPHAFGF